MDRFFIFVGSHPYLFLALTLILFLLLRDLLGGRGIKRVAPFQAIRMINHDDAVVLDVRMDNEFKEGHIINSLHIPLAGLGGRLKELEKYRDKPIIVSCRSGNRSAQACALLAKQGFTAAYNLTGGVMAWQSANLPLSK